MKIILGYVYFFCIALVASASAGCDCNEQALSSDTPADDDLGDPTELERLDLPVEEGDTLADPVDDVEADEPSPEGCAGTGTLTILVSDYDDNPLAGAGVALACAGDRFEATSGADGLASIRDIDLAAAPMTLTCAYGRSAYTITELGAASSIPDPLHLRLLGGRYLESKEITGSIIRTQAGSWVSIYAGLNITGTVSSTYSIYALVGTDLPMSAFESFESGGVVDPVGYVLTRYDSPTTGNDGPDLHLAPASFQTASVVLEYESSPDGPFLSHVSRNIGLGFDGIQLLARDDDYKYWYAGLTTSWRNSATTDTLEAAWVPEAVAASADVIAYVFVRSTCFRAVLRLPDDPSLWSSSVYTVHEPPVIPCQETDLSVSFDEELTFAAPAWADMITYYVSDYIGGEVFGWMIDTPPEAAPFSLGTLPWPSSVDYAAVLPGFPDLNMYLDIYIYTFDGNPFENYVFLTDDEWISDHYEYYAVNLCCDVVNP